MNFRKSKLWQRLMVYPLLNGYVMRLSVRHPCLKISAGMFCKPLPLEQQHNPTNDKGHR
jgi:hypothetical protein